MIWTTLSSDSRPASRRSVHVFPISSNHTTFLEYWSTALGTEVEGSRLMW